MNKGKPWPLDQLSIIEGCNDGFPRGIARIKEHCARVLIIADGGLINYDAE
jgi:hypothetical protein